MRLNFSLRVLCSVGILVPQSIWWHLSLVLQALGISLAYFASGLGENCIWVGGELNWWCFHFFTTIAIAWRVGIIFGIKCYMCNKVIHSGFFILVASYSSSLILNSDLTKCFGLQYTLHVWPHAMHKHCQLFVPWLSCWLLPQPSCTLWWGCILAMLSIIVLYSNRIGTIVVQCLLCILGLFLLMICWH